MSGHARQILCLGGCGASWPYVSAAKYKGGRPREWCERCYPIRKRALRRDVKVSARNAAARELRQIGAR